MSTRARRGMYPAHSAACPHLPILTCLDIENVFRLNKRCVQCADGPLSCEGLKCAVGQVCIQTTRSCDACPSVNCAVDPTAGPPVQAQTNVGAIAGGVVGGVAFIAIFVFIVWKFCLKGKRRPVTQPIGKRWIYHSRKRSKTISHHGAVRVPLHIPSPQWPRPSSPAPPTSSRSPTFPVSQIAQAPIPRLARSSRSANSCHVAFDRCHEQSLLQL